MKKTGVKTRKKTTNKNAINEDNILQKCVSLIINRNITKALEIMRKEDAEHLFKICMLLELHDYCNQIISTQKQITSKLIFKVIENDDITYLDLLLKHRNFNFDVLSDDGLTPIEYALRLYKDYHKGYLFTVQRLCSIEFTRHPKWYDFVQDTKLFQTNTTSIEELSIFEEIKQTTNKTITNINTFILKYYVKTNQIEQFVKYLKYVQKFFNEQDVLLEIIKCNSKQIASKSFDLFHDKFEVFRIFFKLEMYEDIVNHKKDLDIKETVFQLIRDNDYKGLVFMFEYIDKKCIHLVNESGDNLLHILCSNNSQSKEHINTFRVLLSYDSELINKVNSSSETPIFHACSNANIIELLLDCKIDMHHKDKNGNTFLHRIVESGTEQVLCKSLMFAHNILDIRNSQLETPIILATKLQKENFINLLIQNGADVNIADSNGNTVSHYVCQFGLSKVKINLTDETNNLGETPTDFIIKKLIDECK